MKASSSPERRRISLSLVAAVLSAAVFAPLLYRSAFNPDFHTSDFPIHIEIAKRMAESGAPLIPHFLYHSLLIAVVAISNYVAAGFIIVLVATAVSGYLVSEFLEKAELGAVAVIMCTIALLIVGPINFLSFPKHNLYLGYLSPNVYHNPTIALLKPFALAHFILFLRSASDENRSTTYWTASSILLVLGGLAKPSYLLIILPVSVVVAVMRRNMMLAVYVVIPAVLVLGWQYLFTYVYQSAYYPPSGIAIIPFGAMRLRSQDLAPKLLASIAFPLVVAALFWDRMKQDWPLITAWLLFFAGAIYSYLFAETGEHMNHLNFVWCGELAVWLLFICSVKMLLGISGRSWKLVVAWSLFAVHCAGGVLWYAMELKSPGAYW